MHNTLYHMCAFVGKFYSSNLNVAQAKSLQTSMLLFSLLLLLMSLFCCLYVITVRLINVRVLCERLIHDTTLGGFALQTDWNTRPEFHFKAILKTQRKPNE